MKSKYQEFLEEYRQNKSNVQFDDYCEIYALLAYGEYLVDMVDENPYIDILFSPISEEFYMNEKVYQDRAFAFETLEDAKNALEMIDTKKHYKTGEDVEIDIYCDIDRDILFLHENIEIIKMRIYKHVYYNKI